MSRPQVYFREQDSAHWEERKVCERFFDTVPLRTQLKPSKYPVVCRYSALPFYRELQEDLKTMGLRPINSYLEHEYIAQMGWMYDLEDLTFQTWERLEDVPNDTPLVIKGRTNSRKFEWNSKMFAQDKKQAAHIMHELWHDPLIGPQGIVFRRYEPLKTYEIGVNGMPMTNEWRCFFHKNTLLSAGYYWSTLDNLAQVDSSSFEQAGLACAREAAERASEFTTFFVVDVAQTQAGHWRVVELNDGQMSGLSINDPHQMYQNLHHAICASVQE